MAIIIACSLPFVWLLIQLEKKNYSQKSRRNRNYYTVHSQKNEKYVSWAAVACSAAAALSLASRSVIKCGLQGKG